MQSTPAVNAVSQVNKVTSFPGDDFLSRAVHNLERLAFEHRIRLDHRDLQRRHAPAMPQAPMKPAA